VVACFLAKPPDTALHAVMMMLLPAVILTHPAHFVVEFPVVKSPETTLHVIMVVLLAVVRFAVAILAHSAYSVVACPVANPPETALHTGTCLEVVRTP